MNVEGSGFTGFGPRALGFLKALAFHQSREWFAENREIFDVEIKRPMEALIADLSTIFAAEGIGLRADPSKAMFRLYRDTRFAKDKHPFNTHVAAVMSPDGGKSTPGLLYIHLDPAGCFLAAGFWQPEPIRLLALRRAILVRPDRWRQVEAALADNGLVLDGEDALKRLPRGFEAAKGSDIENALRLRHLTVRRDIGADLLGGRGLVDAAVAFASDATPLLRFGWDVLDGLPRQ